MLREFLSAILLSPTFVSAQSPSLTEAQTDSIEKAWEIGLNTVVVTGTRTPKLLKDSPVLTRIITETDIRKTDATDISDQIGRAHV